MLANDDMREAVFSLQMTGLFLRNPKFSRRIFRVLLFSVISSLFVFSFACAPPADSPNGENQSQSSASDNAPELDEETIRDRINGSRVRKVPEENAAAEPISWTFDEDEPKEITVVEKQIEDARAMIILDIKTSSAPDSREPRRLAGQIRTEWILETGWVLRKWEIIKIENISMKYKNLPKPPARNSDR